MSSDESPFEFPCEFPIKAMGRPEDDLEAAVWSIIQAHAPNTGRERLRRTTSRKGNYLSVTVTITAESREQLDAIYRALHAHEAVLMTL